MYSSQFIIAAPTSNSGKTTITLGLLRALKNRGLLTQPFKVGPDYIDPKFHQLASKSISVNLDLFMMEREEVKEQYAFYTEEKQAVCVEGVMGLFDGSRKAENSTAEISKLLKLPVVLVVNAKSVAYSVAPLLYGFKNFDKEVHIAGVIFNQVNTESHYQFLKEACADVGVTSLGYVPFIENCKISSRHLGLSIQNMETYEGKIEEIAKALEKTIDLELLLQITTKPKVEYKIDRDKFLTNTPSSKYTIAIAKDKAFNFSYHQNIDSFKALGEVIYFSPLNDEIIPKADVLYFPGGYPEFYSKALSQNTSMLNSVRNFADNNGHILAECGGMMYLGKAIVDLESKEHSMSGVFQFKTSLENKKLSLGYRVFNKETVTLKGHEFHYSKVLEDENIETIGTFLNARGKITNTKLYQYKNVIASYMHYYLGSKTTIKQLLNLK